MNIDGRLVKIILSLFIFVLHVSALTSTLYAQSLLDSLTAEAEKASGIEQIEKYIDLGEYLSNVRDTTCQSLSISNLISAEKNGSPYLILRAINAKAECFVEADRASEVLDFLKDGLQYTSTQIPQDEVARLYRNLGLANHFDSNYRLAKFYYNRSIVLFKELNLKDELAEVYVNMAGNFRYEGEFDQAAEYYFKALEYYESVGDSQQILLTNEGLGIITFLRGEDDRALEIFQSNLKYFERINDSSNLGYTYSLVSLVHKALGEYDEAIKFSQKSLRIREDIGDVRGQGESLNNLASAYSGKGDQERALLALQQAYDKLTEAGDLRQMAVILGNMGDVKRKQNDYEAAIEYFKLAIEQADEIGLQYSVSRISNNLFQTYAEMGDYKDAFEHQNRYISINDSLFNEEKAKAIEELTIKYQTDKKEQENNLLKAENKNARDRQIGLGLFLGLVIIISLLILSRQRLRIARDEQEKQALKAREALTEAELRNTRTELEYQKNMLVTRMQNILEKNLLIEEMEEKLEQLSLEDDTAREERAARIKELLKMKILTDEDWKSFQEQFETVHKGFLSKLNERLPGLTQGETRLFILLKLDLKSKQISDILGVSSDSVKKARYRLRKKLTLGEGESLQVFVGSFN